MRLTANGQSVSRGSLELAECEAKRHLSAHDNGECTKRDHHQDREPNSQPPSKRPNWGKNLHGNPSSSRDLHATRTYVAARSPACPASLAWMCEVRRMVWNQRNDAGRANDLTRPVAEPMKLREVKAWLIGSNR